MPKKNIPLLMDLVHAGYNRGIEGDFRPLPNGTTFCNKFIHSICGGLGYDKFKGLLANEIVDIMSDTKNGWISVSESVAQDHANTGVIVIAGRRMTKHGHINIIIPGIMEKSPSWERLVPKCANVGGSVFIGKRISFAFRKEDPPEYFCLGEMI